MIKSYIDLRRPAFTLIELLAGLGLFSLLLVSAAGLLSQLGTRGQEESILAALYAENALDNLAQNGSVALENSKVTFSDKVSKKVYLLTTWPDRLGFTTISGGYLPLITGVGSMKTVRLEGDATRVSLNLKRIGNFDMVFRDAAR